MLPEHPGTNSPLTCTCYEHIGQHGYCNTAHLVRITTPAKPRQYSALKKELEMIGYKVRVVPRQTRAMYYARRDELNGKYNP